MDRRSLTPFEFYFLLKYFNSLLCTTITFIYFFFCGVDAAHNGRVWNASFKDLIHLQYLDQTKIDKLFDDLDLELSERAIMIKFNFPLPVTSGQWQAYMEQLQVRSSSIREKIQHNRLSNLIQNLGENVNLQLFSIRNIYRDSANPNITFQFLGKATKYGFDVSSALDKHINDSNKGILHALLTLEKLGNKSNAKTRLCNFPQIVVPENNSWFHCCNILLINNKNITYNPTCCFLPSEINRKRSLSSFYDSDRFASIPTNNKVRSEEHNTRHIGIIQGPSFPSTAWIVLSSFLLSLVLLYTCKYILYKSKSRVFRPVLSKAKVDVDHVELKSLTCIAKEDDDIDVSSKEKFCSNDKELDQQDQIDSSKQDNLRPRSPVSKESVWGKLASPTSRSHRSIKNPTSPLQYFTSSLILEPNPILDSKLFEKYWIELPTLTSWEDVCSCQVKEDDLIRNFKKCGIACLASGLVGSENKFYFFANQLSTDIFFLVEFRLSLVSKEISVLVKVKQKSLLDKTLAKEFLSLVKRQIEMHVS